MCVNNECIMYNECQSSNKLEYQDTEIVQIGKYKNTKTQHGTITALE